MNRCIIREYKSEDIPALKDIWRRIFGDPDMLIDSFYELLPDMGSALVAECNGEIVGMSNVIVGMELIGGGAESKNCGYIYAVAVEKDFRGMGIGAKLSRAAYELALEREAKLVCTLPASKTLYDWYGEKLDMRCSLYRKRFEISAGETELVSELSSTEYMLWREIMLRDKLHLHPSTPTMEFQKRFCKSLGGGLYACGSGICSAYVADGEAVLMELLSMSEEDIPLIASSVASFLGMEKAVYYLPSEEGEPYICVAGGGLDKECIWNLSFD